MKGIIQKVIEEPMFKEYYPYEYDILNEDGTTTTTKKFQKKKGSYFGEGDGIEYTLKENGNLATSDKIEPGQVQFTTQEAASAAPPQREPAINQQKQLSIQRQVCLKASVEFFALPSLTKSPTPEHICTVADMFEHWIETGEIPNSNGNAWDELPF